MTTTRDDELREPINQGPSRRPRKEQARQGQNIRGMLTVLFVSIGLVVAGFVAVMVFGGDDVRSETSESTPRRSGS